jgi:hypothetical protein
MHGFLLVTQQQMPINQQMGITSTHLKAPRTLQAKVFISSSKHIFDIMTSLENEETKCENGNKNAKIR